MDKWADYLISAVRFNSAGTHIDRVRIHADRGDKIGDAEEKTRQAVLASMDNGVTFCTIFRNSSGTWDRGAMVIRVIIDGQAYIKTRRDNTKYDNLDNLPTF